MVLLPFGWIAWAYQNVAVQTNRQLAFQSSSRPWSRGPMYITKWKLPGPVVLYYLVFNFSIALINPISSLRSTYMCIYIFIYMTTLTLMGCLSSFLDQCLYFAVVIFFMHFWSTAHTGLKFWTAARFFFFFFGRKQHG